MTDLTELEKLRAENTQYRKMLWVLARQDGLSLMIDKKDLDLVPDTAELLIWYEPLFDSMVLKGICSPINQPELGGPVNICPPEVCPLCYHRTDDPTHRPCTSSDNRK